jgi:ribosome maturation factor RimP
MNLEAVVERTVSALGYDLVEVERGARGLLRVTIDQPGAEPAGGLITLDDCEKVSRQLQYVLGVEDVDYERLEVSSPGLDRPLRSAADYERFAGQPVELTLREPFKGRRHWSGVLQPRESEQASGWRLLVSAAQPPAAPKSGPAKAAQRSPSRGRPASKARLRAGEPAAVEVLDFDLGEVREARLVPVLDFKGQRGARAGTTSDAKVDGGVER